RERACWRVRDLYVVIRRHRTGQWNLPDTSTVSRSPQLVDGTHIEGAQLGDRDVRKVWTVFEPVHAVVLCLENTDVRPNIDDGGVNRINSYGISWRIGKVASDVLEKRPVRICPAGELPDVNPTNPHHRDITR